MDPANPLHNTSFRKLFAAQVIALVGTGLSTVALTLLAYDLAGGEEKQRDSLGEEQVGRQDMQKQ